MASSSGSDGDASDDILACNHPSVAGREAELRALTDVVRRLIALTVTNTADGSDTVAITLEPPRASFDQAIDRVPTVRRVEPH